MSECCFCSSVATGDTRRPWNEPLIETANFLVIPSLGSLVPGWTLILPRRHFLSMGALPGPLAPELAALKLQVAAALVPTFGDCCAFEHGPAHSGHPVGCGVDHAHLHIVPTSFDLLQEVKPYLPSDILWSRADLDSCKAAFSQQSDYLYLEQPLGQGWIATHRETPRQAFRKAIASALGTPWEFDWREFPKIPQIQQTIGVLSGHSR